MKISTITKRLTLVGAYGLLASTLTFGIASAEATNGTPPGELSGPVTTAQTQDLKNIIAKGDQEINRRLDTLNTLSGKINAATKISTSDKTYLVNEVTTEISGLTSLESQLNADTTLSAARTDAQSIYTEYRVYALVVPKVWLIKTSDDEQLTEGKLATLATKLQVKITADQTAGKDVTTEQSQLNDLNTQVSNAQAISSSIESKVLTLQPSDYDSDHTILSGDAAQLKTAHTDEETAFSDAKSIVTGLKTL